MNDPAYGPVSDTSPASNGQPISGAAPGSHRPSADGPSPPYTAPYPPYPYDGPGAETQAGSLSENLAAGLAYFTVLPAVLFLLLEPYRRNAFVRFHSWQSIFLFIALAAMRSVEMMLAAMIPSAIAFSLGGLLSLLFFLAWLVAVIKAFQGYRYSLPFLGGFAERVAAPPRTL